MKHISSRNVSYNHLKPFVTYWNRSLDEITNGLGKNNFFLICKPRLLKAFKMFYDHPHNIVESMSLYPK